MVVNPSDSHQRISIAHLTERAQIGFGIHILRLPIQMIGFGRVHPPGIHSQFENSVIQVFPINITSLGIVSVIHSNTGRIFHIRRPWINSRLRPSSKVKQHSFFVQFSIRLGHRTEWRPDRNSHVRIHSMDIINHLLRIIECRILEIHCIPQIIMSPILPVLNDTIQRNPQFTILANDIYHFLLALISLLTLPIAISPQWKHRCLPGQAAYLRNYPIGILPVHEVIIHTVTYFRAERCFSLVIRKKSRWIIIPKHAISFGGLEEWRHIFHVTLHQIFSHVPLNHLPILQLPQTINGLFLIQCKRLINMISFCSGIIERSKLHTVLFCQ